MPPRNQVRRPAISALAAAWLAGSSLVTVGCADQTETSNVYCVDWQGNIIDEDLCDGSGYYGGYPVYYWVTTSSHPVGYVVPRSQRTGASYFRSDNQTARTNAGLSPRGRAGSTVSHSGGFGNGSSDGHSGGG